MSFDSTRRNINNYKEDYDTKDINWNNAVLVGTCECEFYDYPLANEVEMGYSNATVCPSVCNILVNTLESTSFNGF